MLAQLGIGVEHGQALRDKTNLDGTIWIPEVLKTSSAKPKWSCSKSVVTLGLVNTLHRMLGYQNTKPLDHYGCFDSFITLSEGLDDFNLMVLVAKFTSVHLLRYEQAELHALGSLRMSCMSQSINDSQAGKENGLIVSDIFRFARVGYQTRKTQFGNACSTWNGTVEIIAFVKESCKMIRKTTPEASR